MWNDCKWKRLLFLCILCTSCKSKCLHITWTVLCWQKIWRCQKRIRGLRWKIPGATAPQFQLGSCFQENTQDSAVTKQNPNCRLWETKIFRNWRSQNKKLLKTSFSVTLRLLGLSQMGEIVKSEIQARPTRSVISVVSTVETLTWNEIFYLQMSFPWTSRVEVEFFRSTHSILLLVVSAGFQSYETETQMSQAPALLWEWDNSPHLTEAEDICHSRQKFDATTGCRVDLYQVQRPLHGPKGFV